MNVKIPLSSPPSAGRRAGLLLLIALGWSVVPAQAQVDPAIRLGTGCSALTQPQSPEITFAAKPGDTVGPNADARFNAQIPVKNLAGTAPFPNNVAWLLGTPAAGGCTGTSPSIQCANGIFNVVAPNGEVSPATSAGWVQITNAGTIAAGDVGKAGSFTAKVVEAADGDPECTWNYRVHVTSTGGGWGDPHITTVDGVAYDFQSAGEFTSLRQKELEIQTRQTAVPTASVPNANPYTGLATCVSIYTAAAARIGSNRVTIQPNISGQPDPSGIQLRLNGKLVELTERGINLMSGAGGGTQDAAKVPSHLEGRIVRGADGAIVITNARGTQVVVTPAFWQSQQTWYLNVNVHQTSANQGIMGLLAPNSWLPALPNGTSLGGQPDSTKERYQQLYETFADAWRVTDATSLFDYAPGTNTATFTRDEWPRYQPTSCAIQGQTSAQPATPAAAAQACNGVTNAAQKADCIFDVTFTGHTGFAQGYEAMQRFKPNGNGWQPSLTPQEEPGKKKKKLWWILIVVAAVAAIAVAASQ